MSQDTVEGSGWVEFLAWLEQHKKQLAIGAGVAIVIGAAVGIYIWAQDERESNANAELLKLRTALNSPTNTPPSPPADYFKIATDYASTSAGQRAFLLGAGVLFDDGKFA